MENTTDFKHIRPMLIIKDVAAVTPRVEVRAKFAARTTDVGMASDQDKGIVEGGYEPISGVETPPFGSIFGNANKIDLRLPRQR